MEISFRFQRPPAHRPGRLLRSTAERDRIERIPHLSRLMALALRFDDLLRENPKISQAMLAALGRVSRPRLTQVMLLLRLAPDLQEELLFLPAESRLTERMIRPVLRLVLWSEQRAAFAQAKRICEGGPF